MSGYNNPLADVKDTLSVYEDHWIKLGLDNNIKIQLRNIKNCFESVFSWDIYTLSGFNQSFKFNIIDKVQEKQEMIIDMDDTGKGDEFVFYRFFLQLITIHEDYMSERYKESYLNIESIVKFMETCKFNESDKQYSDAYHHIARATNVFIALTLKIDSEKLLNYVKPMNNFNQAEKAAVCAVKARIFMEYPPKGNDIALELADRACTLNSVEPEWLLIWLKAKKRVRHHYEPFKMPGDDEIAKALYLYETQIKPKFLIHAYQLYKEAGFVNKMHNNLKLSKKYYNISSDIAKKSIELAKGDTKLQNSILLHCIHFPKYLLSKDLNIENIITKLTNVKNSMVHLTIGRYYLNRKKDYEKAKMYFSRAKDYGNFNGSLQLIKVECLLQSIHEFPYVVKLNELYKDYLNPKNRLTILIHILIYFIYSDYNPKEIMYYLKLYIDQDIEDTIKKRLLMFVRPLINEDKLLIKANEFLNVLSENVNKIVFNNNWDEEERNMVDNTFVRFNKILQINFKPENHFNNDNKTAVYKKNESWRKQQVDKSNESHQQNKESWRKPQNSSSTK
ncbi:uncharacterized protein LOC107882879 [Acyrthosiphon pisum]|uniref:Uncharacterized protein n=1 Tax=Acyrthosiphon pisum TaxID=7029 RepID=A0A8R2D302_ACYPI|nr:uncharacterized protein LOC107882879 [Acyrthosiphon pisum]|eukprot:XP_016657442.1 PREDICTED: uncharacterized protein LOC107882879 [Acyrthosiphon pisum]